MPGIVPGRDPVGVCHNSRSVRSENVWFETAFRTHPTLGNLGVSMMLQRITRSLRHAAVLALATVLLNVSPAHAAGLLVTEGGGTQLQIQDHLVDVSITDQVALTTINQTFYNNSDQRVEATYVFPIPEGADLTDFRMTFNGKMIKGEVLPADEARTIYESIVAQSKDPGLIEFIGRRLLRARIFPIEPKSTTEIQISYQQVLSPMSGMWRYHYPLRTPGNNSVAHGTVRFSVAVDSNDPIKAIWSPTHDVETVRDGDYEARVGFEKNGIALDEDFMLLFDTEQSDIGLSLVSHAGTRDDEDGHFMLLLSPKQFWDEHEAIAQDYVFVLDTSGSMAGEKIEQAKQALSYCVDRLDESDRFSIVRFSTGYDVIFDRLTHANDDAKTTAKNRIGKFKPSGGTNIHDALRAAVELREARRSPVTLTIDRGDREPEVVATTLATATEKRPFVIVFITDGRGDQGRGDVIDMFNDMVGSETSGMHVFPFGVGHDVNTKLLDGLATGYHGLPTYVQPGENLEYVLGDFFNVFSEPVLTDLTLTLPDGEITELFPPKPGDLYHGRQLMITGRYGKDVTGQIVLTGHRGDEEVRYTWDNVSFESTDEADYVGRIWAGRKIAYLLDRIRLHGETPEMVQEVTQLASAHGIQTPYTSWLVAPEQSGAPVDRTIRLGVRFEAEQFGEVARRAREGAFDDFLGQPMPSGGADPQIASPWYLDNEQQVVPGTVTDEVIQLYQVAQTPELQVMYEGLILPSDTPLSIEGKAIDEDAIRSSYGFAAVRLAELNSELRESETANVGRVREDLRTVRNFDGRAFYNFRGVLVDATLTEETELIGIKLGSRAYFDLVMARPELRSVLAASSLLIVRVSDDVAVTIRPDKGIETLDDETRAKVLGEG